MKPTSLIQCILCCGMLATLACTDKNSDTGDSGETSDTGDIVVDPLSCAELAPDECALNESCDVIEGTPQIEDEEEACFNPGESTAVGCMDANMACDDVLTFAQVNDSSGPIHLFVDSCIPEGWSILNLFDYQVCEDEPASCAEKTPEQCVMDDSCQVISGVPQVADETEACYHPGEATDVGCRDAGIACMEALTFGIPSNDPAELHLFNDSCLPSGWEAIDLLTYEVCED